MLMRTYKLNIQLTIMVLMLYLMTLVASLHFLQAMINGGASYLEW